MVYTYQRLAAPNDRNGNPRRLWVICAQKSIDLITVAVLTEGYKGRTVVSKWFDDHPNAVPFRLTLPYINVTATEYRDWVRLARESDSIELREE
jgi:hypothetical protein